MHASRIITVYYTLDYTVDYACITRVFPVYYSVFITPCISVYLTPRHVAISCIAVDCCSCCYCCCSLHLVAAITSMCKSKFISLSAQMPPTNKQNTSVVNKLPLEMTGTDEFVCCVQCVVDQWSTILFLALKLIL